MPTIPIEEMMPREMDPKLKEILGKFSEFLDEIVNFGTHAFKWCLDSVKKGDEHVPIFQSFRHIFDLLDSISVLIRKSCAEPCKVLLRGMFESVLSIEYLLQKNTAQRGKDFLIWNRHHRLRMLRRHDPDDNLYKEFLACLKKDKSLSGIKFPGFPDIKSRMDSYSRLFSNPFYAESEKEYQGIKKKTKRAPKWWFNMHGGPGDVQELADRLGRSAQYELLYRGLSDFSHGMDIIEGKFEIEEPGLVAISQLRLPNNAQFMTFMAATFGLTAIRLFINHYAADKTSHLRDWYIREIQERYLSLGGQKIIEVI
ncbi:MAG: DUF5677 domain-containing protein [Spirochaetota bacterium]